MLVEVLQPVVGLAEEDRQRVEPALGATLADLEQDRLGPVDGDLGVVRLLVPDRGDPSGRADEVPQDGLALDDAPVVLGMDRGGDRVHEAGQVRRAPHFGQPIATSELLAERDQIDRLALGVEREHGLVDVGVLGPIEVGGLEEVPDAQDGIRIDEDRAQDALLGLDRLRRELVDAHESRRRKVMIAGSRA